MSTPPDPSGVPESVEGSEEGSVEPPTSLEDEPNRAGKSHQFELRGGEGKDGRGVEAYSVKSSGTSVSPTAP